MHLFVEGISGEYPACAKSVMGGIHLQSAEVRSAQKTRRWVRNLLASSLNHCAVSSSTDSYFRSAGFEENF
jgi:hypothetical protein